MPNPNTALTTPLRCLAAALIAVGALAMARQSFAADAAPPNERSCDNCRLYIPYDQSGDIQLRGVTDAGNGVALLKMVGIHAPCGAGWTYALTFDAPQQLGYGGEVFRLCVKDAP